MVLKPTIIFDNDNTLFWTKDLAWEKHVAVLKIYGIAAQDSWRDQIYHHNGKQNWQWLMQNHGLTAPCDEYLQQIDEWYLARAHTAPMRDGIADVLALARDHHMALAVASTGRRRSVEGMLRAHGIYDLFDVVVTGDEVRRTKPAPDLYETAWARLADKYGTAIDPAHAVAIEDDPLGVQAAHAADLRVIHRRLDTYQDWAPNADFRADTGDELIAAVRAALGL